MSTKIQMENEHVNHSNNGYKGKKAEGGYRQNFRKSSDNNRSDNGNRKSQRSYLSKEGRDNKPYYKKNNQESNGNYSERFSKDRYENDYDHNKKHEQKKRVTTSKDKAKDMQPDKADIAMRFEKEKKLMQKKKQDSKKNRQQQRPQMKAKRSNNIDWTRQYENDSYDDDDMSYYY